MKYSFVNTKKKIIYLRLLGRIGNQLFQYAFARKLLHDYGEDKAIILIDDSNCVKKKWENSLPFFNINCNVYIVHENILYKSIRLFKFFIIRNMFHIIRRNMNYIDKYYFEKKFQPFLNKFGLILCDNGYLDYNLAINKDVYIEGYFQCEKYFVDIKDIVKKEFTLKDDSNVSDYNFYNRIINNNTVCLSAKYEHNVGNKIFNVCDDGYWNTAISLMNKNIHNPLFFICSDNVDYVVNKYIKNINLDYIWQDKLFNVATTLIVMSKCKYFIIGNTTFAYWAQYLSTDKKLVIAPKKWVTVDMPIDIYDCSWKLV